MARNQERTPQNTFRFMPGRKEASEDGKLLFHGIRYSRRAIKDAERGFLAGVAIGPGQHMPKDTEGPGFMLSEGGVIVPAYPNAKLQTVPVREFTPPNDKSGRAKQYVDWATFQKHGDNLFRVVPCEEERVMYGEIWTGDFDESEGAYQLIQADLFAHGSVAFSGGDIVINAKRKKTKEAGLGEQNVRGTAAELVGERQGTLVAGIPLWIARLWRIHYTAKDSEAILVRQLDTFYLVTVKNGLPRVDEVPTAKFVKHFERLTVDQKLVPVASQMAAAVSEGAAA